MGSGTSQEPSPQGTSTSPQTGRCSILYHPPLGRRCAPGQRLCGEGFLIASMHLFFWVEMFVVNDILYLDIVFILRVYSTCKWMHKLLILYLHTSQGPRKFRQVCKFCHISRCVTECSWAGTDLFINSCNSTAQKDRATGEKEGGRRKKDRDRY